MNLKNKNVLIFGLGKSGLAALELLNKKGANVFLYDDDKLALKKFAESNFKYACDILFNLSKEVYSFLHLVIINPAVSIEHPIIKEMLEEKVKIISEIELAYLYKKGKVVAVTGTNGKTTTVELITHILKTASKKAVATGNIGTAFSESIIKNKNYVYVLEVSSFQLETINSFCPDIACLLNITTDHLNRHHSMKNYIKEKQKIFKNMKNNDIAILNADDKVVKNTYKNINCKVYFFSTKTEIKNGIYIKNNEVILSIKNKKQVLFSCSDIPLLGEHNKANVLCACLVCYFFKVKKADMLKGVASFKPLNHRIEKVLEKNGITFYDDSKGTNTDATLKAVNSFKCPVVLMLGGSNKNESFKEFFLKLPKNVASITVSGENKNEILNSAHECNYNFIYECNSFKESFNKAVSLCKEGSVLLLSPASASFDEFKNYKERGDEFKKLVNEL